MSTSSVGDGNSPPRDSISKGTLPVETESHDARRLEEFLESTRLIEYAPILTRVGLSPGHPYQNLKDLTPQDYESTRMKHAPYNMKSWRRASNDR